MLMRQLKAMQHGQDSLSSSLPKTTVSISLGAKDGLLYRGLVDLFMCCNENGMSGPIRKHWPCVQHSACEQGIQVALGCTKGHILAQGGAGSGEWAARL